MTDVDLRIPISSKGSLSADHLYWAIVEPLWPSAEISDLSAHIAKGTPGQRALFSLTYFTRLVSNGGLAGFMPNNNFLLPEVLAGYKLLGIEDRFEALKNVIELLTKDLPEEEFFAYDDSLDDDIEEKLIDAIYEIPQRSKWEKTLMGERKLFPYFDAYINDNPDDFFRS